MFDFVIALFDVALRAIGVTGILLLLLLVVVAVPTIKLWLDGMR